MWGTGRRSEFQGPVCEFEGEAVGSNNDLRLHLLLLDYPCSAASIYVYHDDLWINCFNWIIRCRVPNNETLTSKADLVRRNHRI